MLCKVLAHPTYGTGFAVLCVPSFLLLIASSKTFGLLPQAGRFTLWGRFCPAQRAHIHLRISLLWRTFCICLCERQRNDR